MDELLIFCYSNHNAFKDIDFRINDIKECWESIYVLWAECKSLLSQNEVCLTIEPTIYAELIDMIMDWMACSKLLKSHIINKL